jgi:hypothetical protein
MRLSYCDPRGHEIDRAVAPGSNGEQALYEAMQMLARRDRFRPGDAVFFADDGAARPSGGTVILTANEVAALASRMVRRAHLIDGDDPEAASDLRLAARLCQHAIDAGWVFRTVVLS